MIKRNKTKKNVKITISQMKRKYMPNIVDSLNYIIGAKGVCPLANCNFNRLKNNHNDVLNTYLNYYGTKISIDTLKKEINKLNFFFKSKRCVTIGCTEVQRILFFMDCMKNTKNLVILCRKDWTPKVNLNYINSLIVAVKSGLKCYFIVSITDSFINPKEQFPRITALELGQILYHDCIFKQVHNTDYHIIYQIFKKQGHIGGGQIESKKKLIHSVNYNGLLQNVNKIKIKRYEIVKSKKKLGNITSNVYLKDTNIKINTKTNSVTLFYSLKNTSIIEKSYSLKEVSLTSNDAYIFNFFKTRPYTHLLKKIVSLKIINPTLELSPKKGYTTYLVIKYNNLVNIIEQIPKHLLSSFLDLFGKIKNSTIQAFSLRYYILFYIGFIKSLPIFKGDKLIT